MMQLCKGIVSRDIKNTAMEFFLFLIITALLIYNSYNIQFMDLKYTVVFSIFMKLYKHHCN